MWLRQRSAAFASSAYGRCLHATSTSAARVTAAAAYGQRRQMTSAAPLTGKEAEELRMRATQLVGAYRAWGYRFTDINPLQKPRSSSSSLPELTPAHYGLDVTDQCPLPPLNDALPTWHNAAPPTVAQLYDFLERSYCSAISLEASHLWPLEEQKWFYAAYEQEVNRLLRSEEKLHAFKQVQRAEAFDHFMQRKFATTKRYGLEGAEAMMPAIDTLFARSVEQHGTRNVVIGMPHRGRLNLLAMLLRYPARNIFAKVKGQSEIPSHVPRGTGDVLSHLATTVDLPYGESKLHVSLLHNPSHLEAVNPVAMGKTRAKQDIEARSGLPREQSLCLLLHGDAATTGQGVVTESLQLAYPPGFATGGVVHLIVNNQLGFTTEPERGGRSCSYASDVGKVIGAPVLRVNANSVPDVLRAARLAADYRARFHKDVIIDLIGYRRHGHNEVDEPAFTQPLMYHAIRSSPSIVQLYSQQLQQESLLTPAQAEQWLQEANGELEREYQALRSDTRPELSFLQNRWSTMKFQPHERTTPVDTGVEAEQLRSIGRASVDYTDHAIHPRLEKFYVQPRLQRVEKGSGLDWATCEAMAFGSLLAEGYYVRICGQDVGRGTFSQRHVLLTDQRTSERFAPLNRMKLPKQGAIEAIDSPLSEFAVMGFEYGYSVEDPQTLPIWEAQFGDFFNGAQITIDQFIASGEDKWLRQSGLVLLLPHGFDGTGPEHSSCRIERFLQLVDGDALDPKKDQYHSNMHVVFPSTPAQYFHLLRRQMKRDYRKPLVIVGPKTLLRDPRAVSTLDDMAPGTTFQLVLRDPIAPNTISKVILCTGKIYYELDKVRTDKKHSDVAIIRLEELAPFPFDALATELKRYTGVKKVVWSQEEHQNMGAFLYLQPRLRSLLRSIGLNLEVQYAGRGPLAPSATGLAATHTKEIEQLISKTFQ